MLTHTGLVSFVESFHDSKLFLVKDLLAPISSVASERPQLLPSSISTNLTVTRDGSATLLIIQDAASRICLVWDYVSAWAR